MYNATQFVGLRGKRIVGDDALLWDKLGLHLFFVVAWFATWLLWDKLGLHLFFVVAWFATWLLFYM